MLGDAQVDSATTLRPSSTGYGLSGSQDAESEEGIRCADQLSGRPCRGCPRNCEWRVGCRYASLVVCSPGRPDSNTDPQARRPAAASRVLGRGAPVGRRVPWGALVRMAGAQASWVPWRGVVSAKEQGCRARFPATLPPAAGSAGRWVAETQATPASVFRLKCRPMCRLTFRLVFRMMCGAKFSPMRGCPCVCFLAARRSLRPMAWALRVPPAVCCPC